MHDTGNPQPPTPIEVFKALAQAEDFPEVFEQPMLPSSQHSSGFQHFLDTEIYRASQHAINNS